MKYFIHIRGANAVGKTSTARSVIAQGDFTVRQIKVAGKEYPYTYDEKRGWIVTGRYDQKACGGLDGVICDARIMKMYIERLIKTVPCRVIVFEAVMYGQTFKFGKELDDMCRKAGFKYKAVSLEPDIKDLLRNMQKRNGGKPVKYESLTNVYVCNSKAANRLKEAGIYCDIVDPSKFSLEDLHLIVDRLVR